MKKISLLLLMALFAMTASAYTYYTSVEIGNFKYYLGLGSSSSEENFAYLQTFSNAGASLTTLDIPGYVIYNGNRYRVTRINQGAFQNYTHITNVTIGYGVEYINSYVFYGCTNLKTVNMPSSVKEIGQYAFQNCTSLMVVAFAGEKAPKIYDYTFNLSSTTKKASTATYRGMNALKADDKWVAVFGADNILRHYSYKVGDFKVYNSTNGCWQYYTIKNGIPYNSNSSNASVRSMCVLVAATFTDGSDYTISLPQSVGNSSNNSPGSYKFYGVADSAFMGNTAIKKVVNNNTMAYKIGVRAFHSCSNLTSADVPVDTIGNYAFYNCTKLSSVTITSNLNNTSYIGSYAFGYCAFTGAFNIPATTKFIGNAPFYCCSSLQKIIVDANNTNYCSYKDALYNKAKTVLYQIPCQWQYGKNGSDIDNNITDFPETLQRILQYAATGASIKYLYLPYNVKTIDQYAFQDCKSLYTVHFPSSVTTVNSNAFKGCDAIRVVYLNKDTPPSNVYLYYDSSFDLGLVDLYVPYEKWGIYQSSTSYSHWDWSRFNIKHGTYDHTNCYDIIAGGVRYTVTSEEEYSHNGFTGDGKLKVVGIPAGTRTIPPTLNYGGRTYVPNLIDGYAAFNEGGSYTINQAQSISFIKEAAFADIKLTNFPFINVEIIERLAFYHTQMNFDLDLTNFQHLTDIGKSAFEGSGITKFVSPISTSVDIGREAFYDCQNLHEMFLYNATTGTDFIGNNASDFKCWINYRKLKNYLAGGEYSTSVIRPYLRLDSEWQSFSCYKPINFEGTGVEAYTVTAYDKNQKKATLSNVVKLEEKNGAVVHGNAGSYYRLNYATGSNLTTSQYLKAVNSYEDVSSGFYTSRFDINATKPQFDKITATFFDMGSSYLELNTSDTGGATTIYTNLSGSVAVPGDVNGDGIVTAADVTALYDYLLNNDTSHLVNGDQTGDGDITAADVTAVYTVLLNN